MPPAPSREVVPISMGTFGARSLAVSGFRVNDLRFAAGAWLPPHVHDHASLAVMLEGSFDLGTRHKTYNCVPGSAVAEPVAERHSNRVGTAGARVLAVQPDPRGTERLGPCAELFAEMRHTVRSPVGGLAWRVARELASADAATPLVVEGLVLEMVALALRRERFERRARQAPPWLLRARDELHARVLDPLDLQTLAAAAGVHPDYLARSFRVWFGAPAGVYARRLRLDWAAERLAATDVPIVAIALDAGFADQSHFTRAFKAHTGVTPAAWRGRSGT